MEKIGFIGTGVMGASIVKHLLAAGYEVFVYNRTKSKTDHLVELGAVWKDTPKKVTEESQLIFTMVGFPTDVEEVYYNEVGVFEGLSPDKTVVDLTTSTPTLAEKIFETATEAGAQALDAPVSGGDLGAQNGTLTTMVGGEEEAFENVRSVFMTFSNTLEYQGRAGAGQHTKMANQIMVAGTMIGVTELIAYANAAGLNLEKVIKTVNGGSASNWSLENYGPRILKEDYSAGFFVKHFVKDLGIALEEAENLEVDLPATQKAKELYDKLAENGHGDDGTQALIKLWWEDD